MAIKNITEVETIETIGENDKLLLNSDGIFKQIDASKIGGSSSNSQVPYVVWYAKFNDIFTTGSKATPPETIYTEKIYTSSDFTTNIDVLVADVEAREFKPIYLIIVQDTSHYTVHTCISREVTSTEGGDFTFYYSYYDADGNRKIGSLDLSIGISQ